jgi:hypothetical protein
MNEPVLEGYYSCPEAFAKYAIAIHGADFFNPKVPTFVEQGDELIKATNLWLAERLKTERHLEKRFIDCFSNGELEAVIKLPTTHEKLRIVPETWKENHWPLRVIRTAVIHTYGQGPLGQFDGQTPLVLQSTFHTWLLKILPDHLLAEIQNGQMSPLAANERLAALNLPALDAMPPLEDFREAVLKEPYWTLPMTVAWIAWRNIDDVVKQHWPYAKHGGHWRDSCGPNQTQTGMVWESADEPKLSGLMISEAVETHFENPPKQFIKESREELWRDLQAGEIIAIGIEGKGSHQKIASERWASLEIDLSLEGPEFVGAGLFGGDEQIYDVRLPSQVVLQIWPIVITDESRIDEETIQPNFRPTENTRKRPSLELAKQAIAGVYPSGIPPTETKKSRDKKLSDWFSTNGYSNVSPRTIQSAIRELNG